MRTHGTLIKWNDDRGFGFILPAKGTQEIFVHISAFPRDGRRPKLNELISFETENNPDGRQRAVHVMRPGSRPVPRPVPRPDRATPRSRLIGAMTLLAVGAIGAYGYSHFDRRPPDSAGQPAAAAPESSAIAASSERAFQCDGRTMCRQMTSCAEARFFLQHCPDTRMDGDHDGEPCEDQWCN